MEYHDELDEKAHLIVEVYCNASGVEYNEYTQGLESMIRVALRQVRDKYKPAYTWPKRYG